ncbi:MAG: hypothetical protein OEZ68_11510 [Gammaproteobacteria bacterium]|nr:hypothetical protein [Gammaproteobacteria bacterium]MDH5801420.1 hypothetical protein [Gammaproteobacteria bacterium]
MFPLCVNAVDFSLFAETTFQYQQHQDEKSQSFNLGQLDLLSNHEISDSSAAVTELVFEAKDYHQGFSVEIERLTINKTFSKTLTLSGGRSHTPLGSWNNNYHHGSLLQNSITRPIFLKFENNQGILPLHMVGAQFDHSGSYLQSKLVVANSNGINTNDVSPTQFGSLEVINSSELNSAQTGLLQLRLNPTVSAFQFGLSAMKNAVIELGKDSATTMLPHGETLFEQEILCVDLGFNSKYFNFLTEYYQLTIEDNPNISSIFPPNPQPYKAKAYFAQAGFYISDTLSGILRYESLDFPAGSTYFDVLGMEAVTRGIVGLNMDLGSSYTLRLELESMEWENRRTESFSIQWFVIIV